MIIIGCELDFIQLIKLNSGFDSVVSFLTSGVTVVSFFSSLKEYSFYDELAFMALRITSLSGCAAAINSKIPGSPSCFMKIIAN